MIKYDYLKHVANDVKKYIEDHQLDVNELTEYQITDMLWYVDDVTGNGKHGQYLTDQNIAKEYVEGNLDLLKQAIDVDVCNPNDLKRWQNQSDSISIDVTLRCCVLIQAASRALADLKRQAAVN